MDDKADFDGERTQFALSVGDADNIDRFDAYRIHETLCSDGFLGMPFDQKLQYCRKRLDRLRELTDMQMGAETARDKWKSRPSFYIEIYEKISRQLENSKRISD